MSVLETLLGLRFGSRVYNLCDFQHVLNLSEPQLSHLQNRLIPRMCGYCEGIVHCTTPEVCKWKLQH